MKAFMSVGQTPSTRAVLCAPYQAHYEKQELLFLLSHAEPEQTWSYSDEPVSEFWSHVPANDLGTSYREALGIALQAFCESRHTELWLQEWEQPIKEDLLPFMPFVDASSL